MIKSKKKMEIFYAMSLKTLKIQTPKKRKSCQKQRIIHLFFNQPFTYWCQPIGFLGVFLFCVFSYGFTQNSYRYGSEISKKPKGTLRSDKTDYNHSTPTKVKKLRTPKVQDVNQKFGPNFI